MTRPDSPKYLIALIESNISKNGFGMLATLLSTYKKMSLWIYDDQASYGGSKNWPFSLVCNQKELTGSRSVVFLQRHLQLVNMLAWVERSGNKAFASCRPSQQPLDCIKIQYLNLTDSHDQLLLDPVIAI